MQDELRFAAHLLGQAAWCGRDRLRAFAGGVHEGIPDGLERLDAAWLGDALQETHPGVRVASVERRGGHSGTTTRERIHVAVDGPGRSTDVPEDLFVKITPGDLGTRIFGGLFELGRSEVRFYREVGPRVPIPIPRAWCARAAAHGGRFVLVLDDLAAQECRFQDGSLALEDARAVMRMFGRLHAAFWEAKEFGSEWRWLRSRDNRPRAAVERMISARANAPALAHHGDVLSDDVRRRSPLVHEHREVLEQWWTSGEQTLLHGDSHAGNMFFAGDEAGAASGLLDWQVVQRGQGIRDVTYFLTNSIEIELRRAHERELIDLYLETLRAHGVEGEGVDRELAWKRHRGHALYTWISSVVTAATPGLQPKEVARVGMRRVGAALDDLESFSLLDEVVRTTAPRVA